MAFQSSPCLLEPGFALRTDSSSVLKTSTTSSSMSSWAHSSVPPVSVSHGTKDDRGAAGSAICCSRTESPTGTWPICETTDQANNGTTLRVLPDFSQVYSFIGSVFDPSTSGHMQKLKEMDPIDVETVLLLMRNLSVNLASPDFEDHRRLISSYDVGCEEAELDEENTAVQADDSEKDPPVMVKGKDP